MKTRGPSFRGQPLVTFALVMGGWTVMRALTWNSLAFSPVLSAAPTFVNETGRKATVAETEPGAAFMAVTSEETEPVAVRRRSTAAGFTPVPRAMPGFRPGFRETETSLPQQAETSPQAAAATEPGLVSDRDQASAPATAPFYPAGREGPRERRWSADAWLLLRRGGKVSLGSGAAPATYGANQAGAVLRYRLAPHSRYRPAAYLRATAALNGSDEKEAAVGLSARPVATLPVVAAAELRATDQPGGIRLRPAVLAVTELPPFDLPLGMRGEAYAQAGYVGGHYSTGFADGQLRVDRLAARFGRAGLRVGAGSWGGAQKGSSRLDIGPTATFATRLGGKGAGGKGPGEGASLRLAIDWRFRVAGNAAPDSGPAITLSAGF